jgi:hypothetical protein
MASCGLDAVCTTKPWHPKTTASTSTPPPATTARGEGRGKVASALAAGYSAEVARSASH